MQVVMRDRHKVMMRPLTVQAHHEISETEVCLPGTLQTICQRARYSVNNYVDLVSKLNLPKYSNIAFFQRGTVPCKRALPPSSCRRLQKDAMSPLIFFKNAVLTKLRKSTAFEFRIFVYTFYTFLKNLDLIVKSLSCCNYSNHMYAAFAKLPSIGKLV